MLFKISMSKLCFGCDFKLSFLWFWVCICCLNDLTSLMCLMKQSLAWPRFRFHQCTIFMLAWFTLHIWLTGHKAVQQVLWKVPLHVGGMHRHHGASFKHLHCQQLLRWLLNPFDKSFDKLHYTVFTHITFVDIWKTLSATKNAFRLPYPRKKLENWDELQRCRELSLPTRSESDTIIAH